MKKTMMKKTISLLLSVAMVLQVIVVPGLFGKIDAEAATSQNNNVFTEDFAYQSDVNALLGSDEWDIESVKYKGTAPEITNGVMKMDAKDGVRFNWTKVPGVGDYDSSKTYTFEFDVKVTDFGGLDPQRDLYVAPGGWYNQVQLNAKAKSMVIGTTSYSYTEAVYENQKLHIKLEWSGQTIKTTLTDAAGNAYTGSRTSSAYVDMEAENRSMTNLVIRSESGVVEVDNFFFSVGTITYKQDFEPYFLSTNQWDNETVQYPGGSPSVENGVMKMSGRDSVQFNWANVDGVGAYDSSKTYTFEFDVKVTDFGNKSDRYLYAAPGGWYNQVEFYHSSGVLKARQGNSTVTLSEDGFLNQKLHVKVAWTGSSITTTVTNSAGTQLINGTRTNSSYTNMTAESNAMTFFVMRCEDGTTEIDNFTFTDGTTSYAEDFDSCGINPSDGMLEQVSDVWDIGDGKDAAEAPVLTNGVARMYGGTTLQFNWLNAFGDEAHDAEATYIYEFDATARQLGKGWTWSNPDGLHTRLLYVAHDEYYTQVELYDRDGNIKIANSVTKAWSDSYKNRPLHVRIEWAAGNVTSTITDASGNVVLTGSRTLAAGSRTNDLSLRCEDGMIDIDNFVFRKVKNEVVEQNISIPEGKQAVYESKIAYSAGSAVAIALAGTTSDGAASSELLKLSDAGLAIGGAACAGTFGEGTYGVKMQMNPMQQAVMVEVTLPNGGVIRRGTHAFLNGCTSITKLTTTLQNASEAVTDVKVTYEDINYVTDLLDTTEPVYEGFEANVYNLVTAFDVDAKTTRTFAWTALESFVGDAAMSVQYRVKGTSDWTTVAAVKEIEKTEYEVEDYFKADITGLTAGTTYEYRIGTASQWGKTYTFTTEAANVNNFSFVAIGDTQGSNWNGTAGGADSRGYMYAQAALKQAIAEVGNPAFILHTGDITEHGTKQSQWNGYFKALGDYGKTIPHFAAIGNHDIWSTSSDSSSGSADNFDLHFNHPNNGGSKAYAEGTVAAVTAKGNAAATSLVNNLDETTYSFNYGNTHFVVLNTGSYDSAAGPIDKIIIEAQTEWLKQDLEANKDAEWTILMMHEPLYHRLASYNRLEGIHKVIENYGVDLAILGHSHLVTRTYPMKNGEIVSKVVTDEIKAGTGTVYSTIGATTPSHDQYGAGIVENMHTVFTPAKDQPTYTTVSVNAGEIKVTIKQLDGLVVDEYTIFKEIEEFTGVTLELSGKIGANFYIPKNHGLSDEAYVEFKAADGTKQTVSIKDSVETKHGRKFTYWGPAKEMADVITATLYDDGEVKDVLSTSIKEYAEILLDGAETNAEYQKAKELINAMLNYGAYAQELFDYNTSNLANKSDKVVDNVASVTTNDLEKFKKDTQGVENFGTLAGATLVLKGETKLKAFFEFVEGASLDGLTFSVDGVAQTYKTSGNYYVVEIDNISARNLDKEFKVTVTAGSQTFDAYVSAMSYCYNALANTTDTKLHNVAKALYLYNKEADAYSAAN